MNNMFPPDNMTCRYTGHKQKCKELFMNCPSWVQLQGQNPNTGQHVNEYNCSDAWIPILLVENSQMQRETGAAVESLRNRLETNAQKLISFASSNTKTKRIE